MKAQRSGTSRAHQIQDFMREAIAHFPDLLALDAETAWQTLHAHHPIPSGLRTQWKHSQAEQAALRALQAAAPRSIALETATERGHLIEGLLHDEHTIPDPTLIVWLQSLPPSGRRLFREQVEELSSTMNIQGYRAIAAEATRIGWPKLWKEDLEVDMKTLCTPNAPQRFWWAVRSTGTDFYRPNELWDVEWALARKQHGPDEQRYYSYTGETLRNISLDTLVSQLIHALDSASYEQKRQMALSAKWQAEQARFRDSGAAKTYYEACQAAQQAEEAYRRVKRLKQQYQ